MSALNVVYHEPERRSYLRQSVTALVLTLGAILGALVALALVVALPIVLDKIGLGSQTKLIVSLIRWPILVGALLIALAVLFRFGPSREHPRWRWVSWGSVVASILWLIASVLFSVYVSHFGSYNKTYGSLAAVIILLLWFYLSAYIVLLAAELNAEMEHQTTRDTTTGAPRPLGERGAFVADTVGETP